MMCGHSSYRRFGHRGQHWMGMMGARARFFGPGEVRLALLSLVAEGPSHGYEVMKKLEERSRGVYRASAGTVYPTLQQLEDEGLIASDVQEGRRVYRVTEAGRRELERRDDDVRDIWRRAQRWGDWRSAFDPDAAEIRGPAERLVKAAFNAVAGEFNSARIERVRSILEQALHELQNEFGRKD
ncbi:MAG TPA: PadR family transcriptional regulator [Candidatus Binataceae bacterium]|nr:PadR family transcriptional regulator [Candidatus Binataceae bacterium]